MSACRWLNQEEAVRSFVTFDGRTQSQEHIKPLHWYVACRLVLEGGFRPENIIPHPPFRSRGAGKSVELIYDETAANGGEATVLGGLKTKNVDVVVSLDGIGPALAVSCKGMTGAFRNLTNRMEETIGECTNLHITYPALVFGYLFVIRANSQLGAASIEASQFLEKSLSKNDIALTPEGGPVESILRFQSALKELTGRRGIRDDVSRYESVALALAEMSDGRHGMVGEEFPMQESELRIERFFQTLYLRYDERFVYSAPDMKAVTRRREWETGSPALRPGGEVLGRVPIGYEIRFA